jgi:hypothetical protein
MNSILIQQTPQLAGGLKEDSATELYVGANHNRLQKFCFKNAYAVGKHKEDLAETFLLPGRHRNSGTFCSVQQTNNSLTSR